MQNTSSVTEIIMSRYTLDRDETYTYCSIILQQQQQQQQHVVEMEGPATGGRADADPKSQNSVPADKGKAGDDTDPSRERRHSMGPARRGSDRGGPGLRKSHSTQSMILRRTGSTATTSRPYDWRTTRSAVVGILSMPAEAKAVLFSASSRSFFLLCYHDNS